MGQESGGWQKTVGIIFGIGLIPGWKGSYWGVGGTFGPGRTGWGPEHPVPEDIKPNWSQKGTFINYVLGRELVGPLVAWIGDRVVEEIVLEEGEAGGSGSDPVPAELGLIYTESAWHQLCIGPARAINAIYADGESILPEPITPETHESGSEVDCGEHGTFKIYWGEKDQPVNTYLGTRIHDEIEVNSRWKFICYVTWKKFMGNRPVWPNLEYDIEVRPYNSGLTATKPWINGIWGLTANSFNIQTTTDGPPGIAAVVLNKNVKKYFKQGKKVTIAGNTANGIYEVQKATYSKGTNKTTVYLEDSLIGANNAGTLTQMKLVDGNAANPAHCLYHMLFNRAPHGIALNRKEWNLQSFEAYGELAVKEGLATSILLQNGQALDTVLEAFEQEHQISFPMVDGLYEIVPIREPTSSDIPIIDIDMVLGPLPEETGDLDQDIKTTRVMFEYRNGNQRYRTVPLKRDNPSISGRLNYKKTAKFTIQTTTHHLVAGRIADLIAPSLFHELKIVKFKSNRGTRRLFPGRVFTLPQNSLVLRCVGSLRDTMSTETEIDAIVDLSGLPKIDFVESESDYNPIPQDDDAEPDLA